MQPVRIDISKVRSNWYEDVLRDWHPDPDFIGHLKRKIERGEYLAPIVLVRDTERDGYVVVNGHHRLYAHAALGAREVKALVIDGTFEETEPLRKAERILKEYDEATQYKYQFSGYLDRWAAAAEGEGFVNDYRPPFRCEWARRLRAFAGRCLRKIIRKARAGRRHWEG